MHAKVSGTQGEIDVVNSVVCPNCHSKLMALPISFPLYDVQCTRCLFRAQVKTARCPPKNEIFGAGWDVLDKNRKAGHLIPPLIVNFCWQDKKSKEQCRVVYFFPFLTDANIRARQRSAHGMRPGYREFNYVGLLKDEVPKAVLLEEPKGIAKVRS